MSVISKCILFLSCLCVSLQSQAQLWYDMKPEMRPGTRWWWHGSAVTKEGIDHELDEFNKKGIVSVEITPIHGVIGNEKNELDFLSPQWMDVLDHTVRSAVRRGMRADMTTGTGWPFGGPWVRPEDGACAAEFVTDTINRKSDIKGLWAELLDCRLLRLRQRNNAKLSYVVAHKLCKDGSLGKAKDITHLVIEGKPLRCGNKDSVLVIALYIVRTGQQVERAAPNGEGLVIDHFSGKAVTDYLEVFDKSFDTGHTAVPHSFFCDSYEVKRANWTPELLDTFYKIKGYRLEEHLPELLGLYGDNSVLCDYRETLGNMLLDNFSKKWASWARRKGASVRYQAHGSPGNLIDLYAAADIPETEGFGLTDFNIKGLRRDDGFTRRNLSDVSMYKYASSAANVTSKPYTSAETFTWLTEHFRTSLSQMKPELDLMFTCGINRIMFHGSSYSPEYEAWPGRKFYASVDVSPTNSIWRDLCFMTKYIERCLNILQSGRQDNDFIVYLPIRNMWMKREKPGTDGLLMPFTISSARSLAPEFVKTVLDIDSLGFDFDYISDRLLMQVTFRNGRLVTASGSEYKGLVIPEGSILTAEMRGHIDNLRSMGAPVVFGVDKKQLASFATAEDIRLVSGVRAIRKRLENGYGYFIANLSGSDVDEWMSPAVSFEDAVWLDPMTGEDFACEKDGRGIHIVLRSGESILLRTFDSRLINRNRKSRPAGKVCGEIDLTDNGWQLMFVDEVPCVRDTFNLASLSSWEKLNDDSVRVTMGTGVYTTVFQLTGKQPEQVREIDLGDVRESARVYINGHFIGCAWAAPFILRIDGGILKTGNNELRIEVTNLPANRIAEMDRKGITWRKFKEINFVDLHYNRNSRYSRWLPVASGLNSRVRLLLE